MVNHKQLVGVFMAIVALMSLPAAGIDTAPQDDWDMHLLPNISDGPAGDPRGGQQTLRVTGPPFAPFKLRTTILDNDDKPIGGDDGVTAVCTIVEWDGDTDVTIEFPNGGVVWIELIVNGEVIQTREYVILAEP